MAYGVVRTDNMYGTDVRAGLVSIKYIADETETEIQNGCVLKVGALMDGEREIFAGSAVAVDTPLEDVVLVASPELMYDERKHSLDQFINVAGKPARGYRLHNGDIFSVTIDALDAAADIEVGDVVELKAGIKLSVVASATGATDGSTVVGEIIAIDVVGPYTFYVILVGPIDA